MEGQGEPNLDDEVFQRLTWPVPSAPGPGAAPLPDQAGRHYPPSRHSTALAELSRARNASRRLEPAAWRGDGGRSSSRTTSGRPCGDVAGDGRARTASGRPCGDSSGDGRTRTASGRPGGDPSGDGRARTASGRPCGDLLGDGRTRTASGRPGGDLSGDGRVRAASGRPGAATRLSPAALEAGDPRSTPQHPLREARTTSGRPGGGGARGSSTPRARAASGRPEGDGAGDSSRTRTTSSRPRRGVVGGQSVWVRVWPSGESELLHVEKAELMSSLGLQARDFHMFDSPIGDQGCCILCRERCVLVDMSYIRGIISSQFMLVMLPKEDRLSVFLSRFKGRIGQLGAAEEMLPAAERGVTLFRGAASLVEGPGSGAVQQDPGPRGQGAGPAAPRAPGLGPEGEGAASTGGTGGQGLLLAAQQACSGSELPFELRALAICLDEVAADVAGSSFQLTSLVVRLVNKLAVLVRMDHVDRLKRLKRRLYGLRHQVQTLCSCLEGLLDEEAATAAGGRLCLTAVELRAANRCRYYQDLSQLREQAGRHAAQASALLESSFLFFNESFDQLQELVDNISLAQDLLRIKLDSTQNRLLSVVVVSNGLSLINALIMGMFGFFNVNLLPPPGPLLDEWGWGEEAYAWRGEPSEGAGIPSGRLFQVVTWTSLMGCYLLLALLLGHLIRRGIMHL